jgi:hypothetical protein
MISTGLHQNDDAYHHQDVISSGKAITYFFDTASQESFSTNESEKIPLPTFNAPLSEAEAHHKSNFTYSSLLHAKIRVACTFISKAYTKALIFPFHSHW